MNQKQKLLKLVYRNPGLTATGYTRLMGFIPGRIISDDNKYNHYYKPATILKELHRYVDKGVLTRFKQEGMLYGKAWRFYTKNHKNNL